MSKEITTEEIKGMITDSVSDAMAAVLAESQKPAVAKDLVETHGEEKVIASKTAVEFFKGIYDHDILGKAIADEMLQTGVDAQGGYTVPTVVYPMIAQEEYQASIIRQYATIFPQVAMTVTLPILSSSIAVTYPNETASGGDTEPVFASRTFSKKRAVAIIPVTNDLMRSSVINMASWLTKEIGGKFGENLDNVCFQDATSPYTGILNGAGKSVTMAAGETITDLVYDDLVDMIGQLKSTSLANAVWVMSPTVFAVVCKIKDANGAPIFVGPGLGVPGKILNFDYLISDQMPTATDGGSADTAVMFFGNLKNYWIGEDGTLEIAMSKDASMALNAGTVSAFQNDLTLVRGTRKASANLAVPNAFCKLETGS